MRNDVALAALAMFAAAAAHAQERVKFDSRDGDLTGGAPTRIEAIVTMPAGTGPHPAIVLLHGCGGLYVLSGSRAGQVLSRDAEWARRLADLGYIVVQPDSFNPRGVREICRLKERPVTSSRERPRDAFGALAWLAARPDVDRTRIVLMGWSHGGGTTLASVAASATGRPADVDFRAAVAFYPGCLESRSARDWRARVPLLILNGELDDWTPASYCRALAASNAGRGVELVVYPGAYHDFDAPNAPVRMLTGLGQAKDGQAHVGTEPAARSDAIARVPDWIAARLR